MSLGDFQTVAGEYMSLDNQTNNYKLRLEYAAYQRAKQEEYAQKFAQEQGGNVADDIDF